MNKQRFLAELESRISALPAEDREGSLAYYEEMINDRVEDGMSEEQAVAELGSLDEIVARIVEDVPITKLVKEKVKPSRSLSGWEIALLILGSPLWLSLLIAAFAVVLSLYVSVLAIVLSLYAVALSLAVAGVAAVAGGLAAIFIVSPVIGLMLVGAGLVCAGIAIFMFLLSNLAAKGVAALTKSIFRGIKFCLIRKENEK